MFRFALMAASLALAGTVSAAEPVIGDAANGEALFQQSECLSCHGTDVFTAEDRKVSSIEELDAQVRLCDSNLNTNWFDSDIHDVVSYLNETYYQFPVQQE